MTILDAQVHAWYSDRPSRPWALQYREVNRDKQSFLQHAGQTNSPDMVTSEMAEAGVDGALLTSLGVYGTNIDLELEAAEQDPRRFRVIGVVDHLAKDIKQQLELSRSRGLLGIRIPEMRDPDRVANREFDGVLQACSDLRLTVMLPAVNPGLHELFRSFPEVFFYLNHLGVGLAPPIVGFHPEAPFQSLGSVLDLAEFNNVGIKLTGVPALSAEAYPFRDIWGPIIQVVDAFGADRVSWGSDYTRTAGLHSYWHGTHYLAEIPHFSEEQRRYLYAQTLIERTGWR